MKPYFDDGTVTLYLGDCRAILPALGLEADCLIADPPYASTSLPWDRWPDGWLEAVAGVSGSMWCFGTLRLFMDRAGEFSAARWKLSHDLIWEKQNGTGFTTDRLKGVHETVGHFYRGAWGSVHHEAPRTEVAWRTAPSTRQAGPSHTGAIRAGSGWSDDGTRIARSVQRIPNMCRRGPIHPTQKPLELLELLVTYACPPGGMLVDPFAGSCSALEAARHLGRRAIGIEADERHAEAAARRLSQMTLEAL